MRNRDVTQEKALKSMENLLLISMRGCHFLFEKDILNQTFCSPDKAFVTFEKDMEEIHSLFSQLLAIPTFHHKKEFIKTLSCDEQILLAKAYFHILDCSIQASQTYPH